MEQSRKKPLVGSNLFIQVIGGLGFLCIGMVMLLTATSSELNKQTGGGALLSLLGLGYFLWCLWQFISPTSERNKFIKSAEDTTAVVLRRDIEERRDSYGGTYKVYFLKLEFKARKSDAGFTNMILNVLVNKKVYDRFEVGKHISIRYAKDDPCLALIEGEF